MLCGDRGEGTFPLLFFLFFSLSSSMVAVIVVASATPFYPGPLFAAQFIVQRENARRVGVSNGPSLRSREAHDLQAAGFDVRLGDASEHDLLHPAEGRQCGTFRVVLQQVVDLKLALPHGSAHNLALHSAVQRPAWQETNEQVAKLGDVVAQGVELGIPELLALQLSLGLLLVVAPGNVLACGLLLIVLLPRPADPVSCVHDPPGQQASVGTVFASAVSGRKVAETRTAEVQLTGVPAHEKPAHRLLGCSSRGINRRCLVLRVSSSSSLSHTDADQGRSIFDVKVAVGRRELHHVTLLAADVLLLLF